VGRIGGEEIRREKIDTKQISDNSKKSKNEKPLHIVFLCHILTSPINKKMCLYVSYAIPPLYPINPCWKRGQNSGHDNS
jgi:hypothetical protein